jgi:hypothetical protein
VAVFQGHLSFHVFCLKEAAPATLQQVAATRNFDPRYNEQVLKSI